MKNLHLLVFTVALFLALPLSGQQNRGEGEHRGGGEHGVGNGHIPQHGPAPVGAPAARPAPPQNEHRKFNDQPSHPQAPHVHAENDRWVDTTPVTPMRTTIWIIPGNMATSRAGSGLNMYGACMVVGQTDSILADSSSPSRPMMLITAAIGFGIATTL